MRLNNPVVQKAVALGFIAALTWVFGGDFVTALIQAFAVNVPAA